MLGAANMLPKLLAAVGKPVEGLVSFGMEELKVAEGHWKLPSWGCMVLLVKVPAVDLPLN
jgi:hypothetical protein